MLTTEGEEGGKEGLGGRHEQTSLKYKNRVTITKKTNTNVKHLIRISIK